MTDSEYSGGLLIVSEGPTVTCPECGATDPLTAYIDKYDQDSDLNNILGYYDWMIENEHRDHLKLPHKEGCGNAVHLYGTHFTGWDHEELAETP